MSVSRTVMMKPQDHVAVALDFLQAGMIVEVNCQGQSIKVEMKNDIEFGHKFAVKEIQAGEDVLKYGEVIGVASCPIALGEHVHVHNLEGKRGRGDKIDK